MGYLTKRMASQTFGTPSLVYVRFAGLFFSFIIYFFVIYIGYAVTRSFSGRGRVTCSTLGTFALGSTIHFLRCSLPSLVQAFHGSVYGGYILGLVGSFQFFQSFIDCRLVSF